MTLSAGIISKQPLCTFCGSYVMKPHGDDTLQEYVPHKCSNTKKHNLYPSLTPVHCPLDLKLPHFSNKCQYNEIIKSSNWGTY